MIAWLYRLVRLVYGLRNSKIESCDLVVPLGYGWTVENELPDAERKAILEAAQIARKYRAKIAWSSSMIFWLGCKEREDEEKTKLLRTKISELPIIASGSTNSVLEAQEIRLAVLNSGLNPKNIVVVLDWPHARSAKRIWEKTFPDSKIATRSIEGRWDSSHRVILQKSKSRWLFVCILRHLALIFLGMGWVSRIQHPTKG